MGSPGIAVPTVGPGGTAGTLPGPTGVDPQQQQQQAPIAQLMQLFAQHSQQQAQPQMVPTGVQAKPSQLQHQVPNFYGITAGVQAIFNHEKQKKLAAAESDWNYLGVALQPHIKPDGSVDIQAAMQDPRVLAATDPKKLKKMAEALNQDWMNPDKTTTHGEALKTYLAGQQKKQQAITGLKSMMSHLIKKAQQPQLTPDQQKSEVSEVLGKAPISKPQAPGIDKESISLLTEMMKEQDSDKRAALKADADAAKEESRQAHDTWKTETQNTFKEGMDRLNRLSEDQREASREATTLKALNIKLSAEDSKRLTITPSQINSEINGTLTSMRQQLSQANSQLKTMETSLANHPIYSRIEGLGKSDSDAAQATVKNIQASIDFIEKNRAAIISGKAKLDDIVDQAQSIAAGTPPGFK